MKVSKPNKEARIKDLQFLFKRLFSGFFTILLICVLCLAILYAVMLFI